MPAAAPPSRPGFRARHAVSQVFDSVGSVAAARLINLGARAHSAPPYRHSLAAAAAGVRRGGQRDKGSGSSSIWRHRTAVRLRLGQDRRPQARARKLGQVLRGRQKHLGLFGHQAQPRPAAALRSAAQSSSSHSASIRTRPRSSEAAIAPLRRQEALAPGQGERQGRSCLGSAGASRISGASGLVSGTTRSDGVSTSRSGTEVSAQSGAALFIRHQPTHRGDDVLDFLRSQRS